MSHKKYAIGLFCLFLACMGCTTISSTMLNRTGGDSFYRNSRTRGVPIRLAVDSHMDVYIEEQFFLKKTEGKELGKLELVEANLPGRHLTVRTEIIQSDKIFTVDFVRPGAGTLDYEAKFNKDYYFTNINNQSDDETIRRSADVAATVGSLFGITTDSKQADDKNAGKKDKGVSGKARDPDGRADLPVEPVVGQTLQPKYMPQRRVVAYKRFDLNDPCFEKLVQEFIDQHLNSCNECRTNDQVILKEKSQVSQAPPALNQ